ncbi:MAG: adenylate/guanylate cyclase domain-containing protein [Zoogloeaceae bacterium]|nr:adenylate/guanylate cyclase domain-containing protein [Zoogloeaceae bacterium]
MNPGRLRSLLGILIFLVLFAHTSGHLQVVMVDRVDGMAYDAIVRWTAPGEVDPRIVIIDIDERSLAEIGRWPWRRDVLAQLVDRTFDRYGALILGFDVILAEPDTSSGLAVLDRLATGALSGNADFRDTLAQLRPDLDYDARLAAAIARHPVLLAFHLSGQAAPAPELPPSGALAPGLPPDALAPISAELPSWVGYTASLPAFQRAALGGGHINGTPDADGVIRRVPLVVRAAGEYREALALTMVRALAGNAPLAPEWSSQGGHGMQLEALVVETPRGSLRIPVDSEARALIPFRGGAGSFRYVSASDIIKGRLPNGSLHNTIVLLGTSAPGLVDLRTTPVGAPYPGVEIHANLISGFLDGRVKARPPYLTGVQLALLVLITFTLLVLVPKRSPRLITVITAGILLGLFLLAAYLWQVHGLFLPLTAVVVLTLALYTFAMMLGYFLEVRNQRSMARLFGQYVPPELVLEMSRDPDRYDMEGRNCELTVLFADIRGFTALSEGMEPQQLARMMNAFFSAMSATVRSERGTLDKYIGDAVMAFWGAPLSDPRHASHAVTAALAMQARLAELNRSFVGRGWPPLSIGIGVNSGEMTVGDMGSTDRRAYTVLGDAVNLGARLVELTGYYGVGIIMGEASRAQLGPMAYRELDRVTVHGRAGAVTLYEPLGAPESIPDEVQRELARWEEALTHYRQQNWDTADSMLANLEAKFRRPLYTIYRDRIARMRAVPPAPDWNGVWHFGRRSDGA